MRNNYWLIAFFVLNSRFEPMSFKKIQITENKLITLNELSLLISYKTLNLYLGIDIGKIAL